MSVSRGEIGDLLTLTFVPYKIALHHTVLRTIFNLS